MASRVGSAVLALTAAALLAVSVLTAAWWSGHPTINGHTRTRQDVYIGLLSAELCNTGGDGTCKDMPLESAFEITRYVGLGGVGLLILGGLLIAGSPGHVASGARRSRRSRSRLPCSLPGRRVR